MENNLYSEGVEENTTNYSSYEEQRKEETISALKEIINILNTTTNGPTEEIKCIIKEIKQLIEEILHLEGLKAIYVISSISANGHKISSELESNPNTGINTLKALLNHINS